MNEQEKLVERLAGKIICYHGTSPENAESILKEGFRAGSYFAYRVEDSLAYGGPYLFAVAFSADPSMWHGEENGFQFHLREAMGPEEILWHTPIVLTLLAAERERCAEILDALANQIQEANKSLPADVSAAYMKMTADMMNAYKKGVQAIRALPPGPDTLEDVRREAYNCGVSDSEKVATDFALSVPHGSEVGLTHEELEEKYSTGHCAIAVRDLSLCVNLKYCECGNDRGSVECSASRHSALLQPKKEGE